MLSFFVVYMGSYKFRACTFHDYFLFSLFPITFHFPWYGITTQFHKDVQFPMIFSMVKFVLYLFSRCSLYNIYQVCCLIVCHFMVYQDMTYSECCKVSKDKQCVDSVWVCRRAEIFYSDSLFLT